MNYKTEVTFQKYTVSISHEECSSFGKPTGDILLLTASSHRDLDTLSRIEINSEQFHRVIYAHWERFYKGESLGILLIEETTTIFIGAGRLSASINFQKMQISNLNEVFLFWTFKKVGPWVLELGELDCFLYTPTGLLIASAPVDPPYDYFITEEGIRFESIVNGTQWLRIPK